MNRTTKMSLRETRWVCLAVLLAGCGSLSAIGNNENDDENVRAGQFSFTTLQPNACIQGCTGVPDGICQSDENNFVCAQDCACGDGQCSGTETPQTCPVDCKYGTDPSDEDDSCGNNHCEAWEHDGLDLECAADCHAGPDAPGTICGDFICEPGETSASCKADCGNTATCGNYICEPNAGETFATCDTDCTNRYVPAGRFVGTYCSGYDLHSRYADGSNGIVDHLVTKLAAGCDPAANDTAYPWKPITNAGSCNGSTLLKPDGTSCTIQNANCNTDASWTTLGNNYVMAASNPNQCGNYRLHNGTFQPIEWAKVGTVNCSPQNPCTVYQCGGQSNVVTTTTTRPLWQPQIARWSIYANKCQ